LNVGTLSNGEYILSGKHSWRKTFTST